MNEVVRLLTTKNIEGFEEHLNKYVLNYLSFYNLGESNYNNLICIAIAISFNSRNFTCASEVESGQGRIDLNLTIDWIISYIGEKKVVTLNDNPKFKALYKKRDKTEEELN